MFVVAAAAFFYRPRNTSDTPSKRLALLVPAHNEEGLIGRCIASLLAQSYPRELYAVTVIADNCSDDTAEAARRAGADAVMVRDEPAARGKGRALRWAMDQILDRHDAPDAIVIVDADAVADRELLVQLTAAFEAGAEAVQADYVLEPGGDPGSDLRAGAFILVNRVRQAGRAALGQTAFLVGNGMLFSAGLLRERPWGAFTSTEDLEYTLDLALGGVRVAFAGGARITCETAPSSDAAAVQQRRWEGGRVHLMRTRAPQLVRAALRRRSPALLGAAAELATPPLGLLASGVLSGAGIATVHAFLTRDHRGLRLWGVAVAALPAYVLTGFAAGRAPRSAWRALVGAPAFVLRKPRGLVAILRFRADSWDRTQRANELTVDHRPRRAG